MPSNIMATEIRSTSINPKLYTTFSDRYQLKPRKKQNVIDITYALENLNTDLYAKNEYQHAKSLFLNIKD